MLIIPAIDIKNGNCVRLQQGHPEKETIYSDDPVEMAKKIESLGAKLIHVVDLDGAFTGEPKNFEVVAKIVENVKIPLEIGGGIRTVDSIERYLEIGVSRIIVGSVVLEPDFRQILKKYAENLIIGVDARDGLVATHGWQNVSKFDSLEFIKQLKDKGVREIIYTDIATDGMLTGPSFQAIDRILTQIRDLELIASGGISSLEDIDKLSEYRPLGLKGCIVGKAFYDGKIDLKKAINKYK